MTVQINRWGPFTQAEGVQEIEFPGQQRGFAFHSVTLRHQDSNGDDAIPTAGTFQLMGRRNGSNIWEPLDVNNGVIAAPSVGGWDIIRVALEAIRITPTSYDANLEYFVTLNGVN